MAPLNTQAACEIICPPDRHIPVEFADIYNILKAGMNVAERARFEQITQLVESLYAQEFMVLRRNLKHNFLRFSMGAKDQPLITRQGAGLPTVAELDNAEQKLVADFMQLMCAARFHILSHTEWEVAKADKFRFSLPVEVNWDYYDNKLLPTFWDSTTERRELRAVLPDMADRVLVFHRGIAMEEVSDYFINEQIDLLIDYVITQPLMRLWRRIKRLPPPPAGPRTLNLTESVHKARKVVERKTLRLLLPNTMAIIKNLLRFKKLKLSEPTFKEVVVLYRAAPKGKKKHKVPAIQRPADMRQREILAGRNIHIKCFHDIPMADMDVIFADKKVYLKMLTILTLVGTVVGALVAAVGMLMQETVNLNLLFSSLSIVAARVMGVYSSAQAERSQTIQNMVNILYDKTNDAQEGVVSMLLEDMADQQLKEAVLTYALLYIREAEMTESMLDNNCETFLADKFNLQVDFAVEDALPRLLEWGMVRRVGGNKYEAAHPMEASACLAKQWALAFKALSEPPRTVQYPLSDLLAGQSKAPALSQPPPPPPGTVIGQVEVPLPPPPPPPPAPVPPETAVAAAAVPAAANGKYGTSTTDKAANGTAAGDELPPRSSLRNGSVVNGGPQQSVTAKKVGFDLDAGKKAA